MALTGVMSFWPEVVKANQTKPPSPQRSSKAGFTTDFSLDPRFSRRAGSLVGKAVLDASSKAFRASRGLERCSCCPLHHPLDRCFVSAALPLSPKPERSDLKRTANA